MTIRRFEVGDKVRVNCPGSAFNNMETTVISKLRQSMRCLEVDGTYSSGKLVHDVDINPAGFNILTVCFEPHELIPLYDGNQLSSWSECVWKPKQVKV